MACKRASMRTLFLLLLLLLLVTEEVEGKGKGRKGRKGGGKKKLRCKKLEQNKQVDAAPEKVAQVTCQGASKIFDLQVTSFQQKKSCTGVQAHALVRSNTCIGHGTCLDLPLTNSSPIIKATNETCVGLHPDKVAVSVSCTKDKEIVKMDADSDMVMDLGNKEGILASPAYPWQYSLHKKKYQVNFQQRSVGTFYYTLYKLDLGEGDNLTVGGSEVKGQHQPLHGHVTGRDIPLTLTRGSEVAGDGFILCYKWADKPVADVCKELTELPMSLEECKPRGRRKKGKGRKKKKNKKNKDKKRRRNGKGRRRKGRRNRKETTTTPMTTTSE